MTLRVLLMLIVLSWRGFASDDPRDAARTILAAQDGRDANALLPFLGDRSSESRQLAAIAAASVQDTVLLAPLLGLLGDPSPQVRSAASFALGQLGPVVDSTQRSRISLALLRRSAVEPEVGVALRVVEALGLVGDAASLRTLVAGREGPPTAASWETALSIGRYAYRGLRERSATAYAVRLLDRSGGPDRWKAAYALMRIGDRSLLEEHGSRIAAAAQGDDPDVRMFAASALAPLAATRVALLTLQRMAAEDPDWRVRVNAVKALRQAEGETAAGALLSVLQAVDDSSTHVALTALSVLGEMRANDSDADGQVRPLLLDLLRRSTPDALRRAAAIALAQRDGAEALEVLQGAHAAGALPKISFAEALGEIPDDNARAELLVLAGDPDPRTARRGIEGLLSSCRKGGASPPTLARAKETLVATLTSSDPALLTLAAEGLGDSLLRDGNTASDLLLALQRLRTPQDVEPMGAIIRSLGLLGQRIAIPSLVVLTRDPNRMVAEEAAAALVKITGESYPVARRNATKDVLPDGGAMAEMRQRPGYTVRTTRGSFTIALIPDSAPLTCLNFASLAKKRFYDGLVFHRVVPNFVVQGGDPRGDGWGGPGYAIRSEFGPERYDRGTIGMASSGKDTEGSQFFVTHSRQPHLDGRYTLFARVTSGMNVVDRLQVGDRILEIAPSK